MKNWFLRIVAGVVAGVAVAWFTGFLNHAFPAPARAWLAIENLTREDLRRPEDGFRIILCWLENDGSGVNTRQVETAFSGVGGIKLVRSARIVSESGASDDWREGMKEGARQVMEDWNADLAIAGFVKKPGEVLSLWFVPRSGDGTLGRGDRPYRLEDVTLGPDFGDDLRAQLTSAALLAVAPLAGSEARGRVLLNGLEEVTERVRTLLAGRTIGRAERRGALQRALGNALVVLGGRDRGSERLEEAVAAYRAALELLTRERLPRQWASTLNNMGVALRALGERESGPERHEQAVEAYRAALEVRTRESMPREWAATQINLGAALWMLGKREGDTGRLEQAVDAFRAALEVRTRGRAPIDWASAQNNLGNVLLALGRREMETALLEESVKAYRAALAVFHP